MVSAAIVLMAVILRYVSEVYAQTILQANELRLPEVSLYKNENPASIAPHTRDRLSEQTTVRSVVMVAIHLG